MCKRLIMVLCVSFGLWANAQPVLAQVNHVSINSRQSELDQPPLLKVNLVAQNDDWSQLSFYLRQKVDGAMQQQELTVEPINRFLLQITGAKTVTDPNAQVIIMERHASNTVVLAVIALFDAPLSFASAVRGESKAFGSTQLVSAADDAPQNTQQTAITAKTTTDDNAVAQQNTSGHCQIIKDNSDTLWRIAERYKNEWNTSVYGAMLAIFEANLLSFSKQKIHLLLKNAPLVCPSSAILAQYDNKAVDKEVFEVIEAKHAAK